MAVGSRQESKGRRRDSPLSPRISSKGPRFSLHGMSYNPPVPVSDTGVAQPLAQQSRPVDGTDHPAYPTTTPEEVASTQRPSKGKVPPVIKRASSTPHMRALALGESGPISPNSDKRRNKLGYHRTSVACGHCRRRKIRCLLAPDDPQGRCSNCIRLKKECNFYPVEQQNPGESRAQSAKRGSVSQVPSSSTSSSPRASNASGHEAIEEYGSFQPLPTGEPPPGFAVAPDLDGPLEMKSHHGGVIPQQPFPYSPSFDLNTWGPNYGSHPSSDGHSDASSMAYWSASGPPASSPFFAEPVGGQAHHNHEAHRGSIPPQHFQMPDQPAWSGLIRSVSYGGPEGLPPDYRFQHPNALPQQQRHTTHGLPSSMGHASEAPNAPLQSSVPPGWQPFMPGPEGSQAGPVQPYTSQWFSEPTSLGAVEEEQNPANPFHHPY